MTDEKGVRTWKPEENRSEQAGIGRFHHLDDPIFFSALLNRKHDLEVVVCAEFVPLCRHPFMRQLVCPDCVKNNNGVKLHSADKQAGFTMRKVWLTASVPEGHGIKTIVDGKPDRFEPLEHLLCDVCGAVIADVCMAVTVSPPGRQIGPWEQEYGQEITAEQADFIQKLKGEK